MISPSAVVKSAAPTTIQGSQLLHITLMPAGLDESGESIQTLGLLKHQSAATSSIALFTALTTPNHGHGSERHSILSHPACSRPRLPTGRWRCASKSWAISHKQQLPSDDSFQRLASLQDSGSVALQYARIVPRRVPLASTTPVDHPHCCYRQAQTTRSNKRRHILATRSATPRSKNLKPPALLVFKVRNVQ